MHPVYKFMFVVSMALTILAMVCVFVFGLRLGVDFKGGSVLELEFKSRPLISDLQSVFSRALSGKDVNLVPVGDNGLIVKTGELSEPVHQSVLAELNKSFAGAGLEEKKFDSVGPLIGKELESKSITAIILVLISILIYIAIVFRKMSRVLSPWAMGIAAIVALIHDLFIPFGVFAILGHFYGIEVSAVFVAAALTILGFSVSDTVVVFDRVRENILREGIKNGFGAVVHKSVMQTLVRSLNTTFAVLLSLIAIFFFGGESIKYFSLALIIGIFLGSYSSIFVASPLLVWWSRNRS